MLEQMEGRWNVEVFSTWQKKSQIQEIFSKKVVSGQPTGPNIMWLCDEGEFTHATIKGEKKPSQSNLTLTILPGRTLTMLYNTWEVCPNKLLAIQSF